MITIVCVYNNKKIFSDCLLKSLQAQSAQFELIALDNGTGAFGSAAQALNHGALSIRADSAYIMFAHQDISFFSASLLADVELMLNALPNLGIAGVAGNSEKENRLIANITHGTPARYDGYSLQEPVRAMTVDECCAIVPRDVFQNHQFDTTVCDNWHLYVVEYCLRIQSFGLGVFVLPVDMHHGSKGRLNASYFMALKKVLARYKNIHQKIYTSCGCWDTATPIVWQAVSYLVKKYFYGFTRRLIASGLVPEWVQRKKNRRLQKLN
jgi:hypothetical protein